MTHYIQVITTVDQEKIAHQLAGMLLEKRLAACVQIVGPVQSTYRWLGTIKRQEEWLCLIKTEQDRYGELEQTIKVRHPYDVPEILVQPISHGNPDYLDWLSQSLTKAD